MRFLVLGTLQASARDGERVALGGRRQRLVLALLVLHIGRAVSVDALIDGVWGERPPPTARKTLQVYVSRLRRALGDGDVVAARDGYVLQAEPGEVDAVRFERLVAQGRGLLERDPAAAAAELRTALGLWRGAPWGELADEPALSWDAERLRELRLGAVEDRLAADLAVGRAAALVGELGVLVADHPLRERLRGQLMLTLYRQGQTAAALRVFEEGRALLAEELGADPGADLQTLHRRILEQDPGLLVPSRPARVEVAPPPGANPYKGLSPFGEDDAAEFFGRDRLVRELLERVISSPFITLVGPSGCGKSSVVRAGLVPALRRGALPGSGGWRIAVMTPGAHPFAQLEAALLRSAGEPVAATLAMRGDDLDMLRAVLRVLPEAGRLVLVIDQLEELFLQVRDAGERDRFVRNLTEAVEDPSSGLTVVTMLRADLLERPMAHPRLGPLLGSGLFQVLPLTPAELEAACVTPAARAGVTVEADLAAELVAEAAERPGALPLFQYTLTELFDHRRDGTITHHAYRALGGLQGVVARRAEETFTALDAPARAACRQVFLRLVTLGEEGEVGRRRAARAELATLAEDPDGSAREPERRDAGPAVVELVLARFGSARLLAFDRDATSGRPTVEVAHEALLRAWPRLQGWIADSQEDLRVQRWVSAAVADWEGAGHDADYLLSGARLDVAEDWLGRASAAPTAAERAFVDASLAKRQREQQAEQARQERELALERRAAGRLRLLVAVLAAATLVAGALGAVAALQRSRAQDEAAAARAATELIRARQLASAAVATRRVDPELSLLLALHAVNITGQADIPIPAELVETLHWALQAGRVQYPGDPPGAAVAGPEGPQGVFRLPVDELVALARANVTRELTPQECLELLDLTACPTLPATLPALEAPDVPATIVQPGRALAGTRVTMLTPLLEVQNEALGAELAAFSERSGIEVDLAFASGDQLGRLIVEGRPPDIAVTPQPAAVAWAAREGALIDLAGYLDTQELRAAMSNHLIALGTVGDDGGWPAPSGRVYGLPLKLSNKSVIWYSIPAFEAGGYDIPATYEELVALSDRIAADGLTPWCLALGSGSFSGWPGTDVVENLLLHDSLADYDGWLVHEVGFDSPPLRRAFERMARLLLAPGHLYGGPAASATLNFELGAAPLFDDPPGCLLYPMGTDALAWFPFGAQPGRDVGVFPFPPVTPAQGRMVLGAGDYAGAFADRPEVREVMRFLTGEDFGRQWARIDPSFISPRADFPVEAYVTCTDDAGEPVCVPDPVRATLAPPLADALREDRFRFDGSDLLPHDVGLDPMWGTMVAFVGAGPGNLDDLLADLEATWVEREQASP